MKSIKGSSRFFVGSLCALIFETALKLRQPICCVTPEIQDVVRRFYKAESAISRWRLRARAQRKRVKKVRGIKLSVLQQVEAGYVILAADRLRSMVECGYLYRTKKRLVNNEKQFFAPTVSAKRVWNLIQKQKKQL